MATINSDENSNLNTPNEYPIKQFEKILKLHEVPGTTLVGIKSTTIMYLTSSQQFTRVILELNMGMDLNMQTIIVFPKQTLFFNCEIDDVSKLRIKLSNLEFQEEIISCRNYLQRQRNIILAISVVRKCWLLFEDRKLILDMLYLYSNGIVSKQSDEDTGIVIDCTDRKTQFKYFVCRWKIKFDCINNSVTDFLDFFVNTNNGPFYATAKKIMNKIVQPNILYNKKVEFWWNLLQAVNSQIELNPTLENTRSRNFVTVRIQDINLYSEDLCEIIESDDEDCIVIEN